MRYDVYISYSHRDVELARSLAEKLELCGLGVFLSSRDIAFGVDIAKVIPEAIENSDAFLLLLTESYNDSNYGLRETYLALEQARKTGKKILPIVTAPEKVSEQWKFLLGNIQWITGPFEDASAQAVNILAKDKRELRKAEAFNRALEYRTSGQYFEAEQELADLLKDPVYADDPEVLKQHAQLLQYTAVSEQSHHATNEDEFFAAEVLTARMESAERFEKLMGSSLSAAELNCLLIDYTQMVNFRSAFAVSSDVLDEKAKQCKTKIAGIKELLKTEDLAQGKETMLVKAYRSYLGLARPEYPLYDVFISCKSEDEKYARQVYEFLLLKGKRPFFAKETISSLGNSEYHDAIMAALDHSKHFILVSSSMDHLNSTWVKHEWSTYVGESVEGRKNGNMILIFHEDFHFRKDELPIEIRRKEIISLSTFRNNLADYLN